MAETQQGQAGRSPESPRRQRILVIFLASELTNAARVHRQCQALATRYDVVMAGYGSPPAMSGVEYLELPAGQAPMPLPGAQTTARILLRQVGLYGPAYFLDPLLRLRRRTLRRALPVDAVVANDLAGLPLARSVADGAPVVFDAHEHWTSESASWNRLQRLSMRGAHEWLVDRHVLRAAGMMTVSPGIARDYRDRAGVSPALVTNAPLFRVLPPSPVSEPMRLVHIGLPDRRRRLEDTIEAVSMLDGRFVLDLILAGDNAYRRELETLAAADPRVTILPAVATARLIDVANGYDVGVALFRPDTPNLLNVLPNKLFDYIQARLAVAVGPSPDMVDVVNEWDCGIVSPSFTPEDLAATLARLSVADVERLKANADRAAAVLTADRNRETVIAVVERAIAAAAAARQ